MLARKEELVVEEQINSLLPCCPVAMLRAATWQLGNMATILGYQKFSSLTTPYYW